MFQSEKYISVVVPIYNVSAFLPRCLESLMNSDFQDIEYLLIDDCSPDNSLEICQEYCNKDDRFRVIHKEVNAGVSEARNTGLKDAKGRYVMFLDGDDYVSDGFISRVAKFRQELSEDIDTICCGYKIVAEDGKELGEEAPILWPKERFSQEEIFDGVIDTLFVSVKELEYFISHNESYYEAIHKHKQMGSVWRFVFDNRLIHEKELLFDTNNKRGGEDIEFLIQYLSFSNGMVSMPGCDNICYVQREGSFMHRYIDLTKKMSHMLGMERAIAIFDETRREAMRNKWGGQRVLITMNMARSEIGEKGLIKGYKDFKTLAKHPISHDALNRIKLKGSKLKYHIAIGMLKAKMYFCFYFCIWLLGKMGKDVAPM